jgi:hypothetical protein
VCVTSSFTSTSVICPVSPDTVRTDVAVPGSGMAIGTFAEETVVVAESKAASPSASRKTVRSASAASAAPRAPSPSASS